MDRIGGRMALVNINGHKYEAGASVIHPRNMYMVNFTKQFGECISQDCFC